MLDRLDVVGWIIVTLLHKIGKSWVIELPGGDQCSVGQRAIKPCTEEQPQILELADNEVTEYDSDSSGQSDEWVLQASSLVGQEGAWVPCAPITACEVFTGAQDTGRPGRQVGAD